MNWIYKVAAAGIVAVLAMMLPALACANDSGPVTLDLANADVESVIKVAAEITGRSFVIDPRVKGAINVISGRPIPRNQLYSLITSALRMQGYAVVESNGVTKILPSAEAGMHAPSGTDPGNGDRLLTQIFQLRNSSAAALLPVLKPLISTNSLIAAAPGGNALLVTDYAENVRRVADIIAALDGGYEPDVKVIPMQHASAVDVASQLGQMFASTANNVDQTGRVIVQADNLSNSLLVRTTSAQRLAQVHKLAEQLDQASGSNGNIHVVHLKNAEATTLAKTLRAIVSGTIIPPAMATASAQLIAPTLSAVPGQNTAPAMGTNTSPFMRTAPSESATAGQNTGYIQADPATNTLIITASEPVFLNLRRVIDQLDRRRAQVFIEALVVELTSSLADEFGVQWQLGGGDSEKGGIAGTNFSTGGKNIFGLVESLSTAKTTGSLGVATGLNIGFFNTAAGIAGLVRALATDARANILSTPSLLTLDNEEARIVIGQNVPFLTGQYVQNSTGSTATPFQTIERKDVGLTLQVRPQISEGGTVRLQIQHEVSSLQQNTSTGPITSKRAIDSAVLVDDGMIVVIGGLMQDSVNKGTEKVPGLGDLPVVGGLFRYNADSRAKTNLMIFLRPRILRDAAAGEEISSARYARSLDTQRSFNQYEKVGDGPQLKLDGRLEP